MVRQPDNRTAERISQGQVMVERNRYMFSSPPGRTEAIQHEICIGKEVRKMLELGVFEESHSAWRSSIVLVPKPDGSVHFCNVYRKLNEVSEFDADPMPWVDDLIHSRGHARFLPPLDLTKRYWHVQLTPTLKEKTAFATLEGLYQDTLLPSDRPPFSN